LWCLVSSRAFRQSPICRHCSGVRNIMHIGALCSHGTKNNQHNSSTQPQKHNRAPCPTAPSAHASYKGYGFDNAKPPRSPHHNTMMDVVVLRCGPTRMGEGAAAPFNGVHIMGKIRPAGGFDTLAESRWAVLIGPSIPARKINHATINRWGPLYGRRIGSGMERRPCLWRRILRGIFDAWGG
jgi:hypothetical protein